LEFRGIDPDIPRLAGAALAAAGTGEAQAVGIPRFGHVYLQDGYCMGSGRVGSRRGKRKEGSGRRTGPTPLSIPFPGEPAPAHPTNTPPRKVASNAVASYSWPPLVALKARTSGDRPGPAPTTKSTVLSLVTLATVTCAPPIRVRVGSEVT